MAFPPPVDGRHENSHLETKSYEVQAPAARPVQPVQDTYETPAQECCLCGLPALVASCFASVLSFLRSIGVALGLVSAEQAREETEPNREPVIEPARANPTPASPRVERPAEAPTRLTVPVLPPQILKRQSDIALLEAFIRVRISERARAPWVPAVEGQAMIDDFEKLPETAQAAVRLATYNQNRAEIDSYASFAAGTDNPNGVFVAVATEEFMQEHNLGIPAAQALGSELARLQREEHPQEFELYKLVNLLHFLIDTPSAEWPQDAGARTLVQFKDLSGDTQQAVRGALGRNYLERVTSPDLADTFIQGQPTDEHFIDALTRRAQRLHTELFPNRN